MYMKCGMESEEEGVESVRGGGGVSGFHLALAEAGARESEGAASVEGLPTD